MRQSNKEIALPGWRWGWIPTGPFYRQSDIPEISELTWVLSCNAAKGLMNRAHAYKAAVQANEEAGEDPDFGITMGLFSYPVLMAADILMFNASHIPGGATRSSMSRWRGISPSLQPCSPRCLPCRRRWWMTVSQCCRGWTVAR